MISDNSLKEYYILLNTLYENAVNIMTAMTQSLSSTSSEVQVNIVNSDNISTTVRIPSFLYLENKLEELDLNIKSLFLLPKSGSAWFSESNNMYKLYLSQANVAPEIPDVNLSKLIASTTDNNFLKDLVNPKTYLKLDVSNLESNIHQVLMKKVIIHDSLIFDALTNADPLSYDEVISSLYSYEKGVDYDEYESVINAPLKNERYNSLFSIINVNSSVYNESSKKYEYEFVLDTLLYNDSNDHTIEYILKEGDKLSILNELVVYRIKQVQFASSTVLVEEIVGHQNLSSGISLTVNDSDFSDFKYILIPLEENQYICIFIAGIYDNVRSLFSKPIFVDLSKIKMYDENGVYLNMSYMDYYNMYCNNVGDLLAGISQEAYPLISNYTSKELEALLSSDTIKALVNDTINVGTNVQVVPINKHLVNDVTNEEIIRLHTQKNEFNSNLVSILSNIDSTYNTLINTDFSQNKSVSQLDLSSQLTKYYNLRISTTKQLIQVVNNLNTKLLDSNVTTKTKYRLRGVSSVSLLANYFSQTYKNVEIIGLDLEYKYKSSTKDTSNVYIIEQNTFTDWNKQYNIDRLRNLSINTSLNKITVEFESYDNNDNKIKWNLIDIPIQQGEDLVIRYRYKYSIGLPFVNLYTPWSDEKVVTFPDLYTEDLEILDIADLNKKDAITATFNSTLINDGYAEHINNKIINGLTLFLHSAENIYSGFNTAENNLISLKDKLYQMNSLISSILSEIERVLNNTFAVYLQYDDVKVELFANLINKINFTQDANSGSSYIRKDMNIVIQNTGDVPVYFYSLFPGNTNIPLLMTNNEYYNERLGGYQSVPLFANNVLCPQVLGQWIYFRSTNPYTGLSIYNVNKKSVWFEEPSKIMRSNFNLPAFAYRNRTLADIGNMNLVYWNAIQRTQDGINSFTFDNMNNAYQSWDSMTIDKAMYKEDPMYFINRYEDIFFIDTTNKIQQKVYLSKTSNLSNFVNDFNLNYVNISTEMPIEFKELINYNGAFLFPNLHNMSQILTNGDISDKKVILPGDSVSIPIVFEYFMNGTVENFREVTKGSYFDLKNSLFLDPKHYMIEITAKYDIDYDSYNYTNIVDTLSDDASDAI